METLILYFRITVSKQIKIPYINQTVFINTYQSTTLCYANSKKILVSILFKTIQFSIHHKFCYKAPYGQTSIFCLVDKN